MLLFLLFLKNRLLLLDIGARVLNNSLAQAPSQQIQSQLLIHLKPMLLSDFLEVFLDFALVPCSLLLNPSKRLL
jgi:hypothetical protein